jgi:hypothetical protein
MTVQFCSFWISGWVATGRRFGPPVSSRCCAGFDRVVSVCNIQRHHGLFTLRYIDKTLATQSRRQWHPKMFFSQAESRTLI